LNINDQTNSTVGNQVSGNQNNQNIDINSQNNGDLKNWRNQIEDRNFGNN